MSQEYKGVFEMPQSFKKKLWPNLDTDNYLLTSEPTEAYNCVAWALGIDYEPIDFSLDEDGEPIEYPDLSCLLYVDYFEKQGFELCETPDFEQGYEKIVLYERDSKTFEHVARQVKEGIWESKLGAWEDIEHTSLEAIEYKNYYGVPTWYMKRIIK